MKIRIAAWISIIFLRLIYLTIRWQNISIPPGSKKLLEQKKGFLLALWHNQIPYVIHFTYKFFIKKYKLNVVPMASQSKDGELATRVIGHFGMKPKRGSSKRGGSAALKALVQDSKNGSIGLITPDGPTGPVYKSKPGIIQLASLTGFPIICYSAEYDRYWTINSWDRTLVPKPFSKVRFKISEPFFVPKIKGEEELQKWTNAFENFLLQNAGLDQKEAEKVREEIREKKETIKKRNS